MQVYQQFDVDIVPSACDLIKSEAPAHTFLANFWNFPVCNFIKNKTPAQVFSSEFYKIFENTYVAEYL